MSSRKASSWRSWSSLSTRRDPDKSADGKQYEIRNRVILCRRGESKDKPFCDGSHAETGKD
ncbi:MAG: CDGSH iron-sulfur domain-containing protein [Methanosarcina sp.]